MITIRQIIDDWRDYQCEHFWAWMDRLIGNPSPRPPFTFAVGRDGRDVHTYREPSLFATIYTEMCTRDFDYALSQGGVRKGRYPELDTLTGADRARILGNLCAYFDRNGITYRVLPDKEEGVKD